MDDEASTSSSDYEEFYQVVKQKVKDPKEAEDDPEYEAQGVLTFVFRNVGEWAKGVTLKSDVQYFGGFPWRVELAQCEKFIEFFGEVSFYFTRVLSVFQFFDVSLKKVSKSTMKSSIGY